MGKYNLYFVLLFVAAVAFLIVRTRSADGFAGGSDVMPQANGSSSSSPSVSQQIVLPAGSSSSSNLSNILNNTGRLFSSSSSAIGPRRYQLPPFQITFIRDYLSNDDEYIPPEVNNTNQATGSSIEVVLNTLPTVVKEPRTTIQIIVAATLIGSALAAGAYMFGVKM